MSCNCRVGRCDKCPSLCKRCGCSCDGIDPAVALSRKRGRPTLQNTVGKTPRKAAKKSRKMTSLISSPPSIALKETRENIASDSHRARDINDIWNFFGLTEGSRSNLPNKELRKEKDLRSKDPHGWSTVVQATLKSTAQVAEILYPGDSSEL